jgi:two-component system, sensor histidine kinase and response regulator
MATILIADDERINRALLRAYLVAGGHEIQEATNGEEAVAIAAATPIDLALLDVMMPGLDGFETTRRLKAAHADHFLPIILVTALTDQPSRRLGLLAGADEFLCKPVDPEELTLRIRNLLALRDTQLALLEQNIAHVELHRFRDEMTAMLVHDLKNPLGALLLNLDCATSRIGTPDGVDALADALVLGQRLHDLVTNMLEIQRLESARLRLDRREVELHDVVTPILTTRRWQVERQGIAFEAEHPAGCRIEADSVLLTRLLENLLDNALRHTPQGGRIMISGVELGEHVMLRVGNTGTPIPEHSRQLIFEKHGQVSGRSGRMNLGLGLYFCRLVAEAHEGRIWVEQSEELATVFVVEIPKKRRVMLPTDDGVDELRARG